MRSTCYCLKTPRRNKHSGVSDLSADYRDAHSEFLEIPGVFKIWTSLSDQRNF